MGDGNIDRDENAVAKYGKENILKPLSQKELKEYLHYDEDTGIFTRIKKSSRHVHVGDIAGTKNRLGYITTKLHKQGYLCHRLAWLYVYGEFPDGMIDHINRIPSDNRIKNLRVANGSQNRMNSKIPCNNSSGYKGVVWNKSSGKWQAQAMLSKKTHYLGVFVTAEQAATAYKDFISIHHGDFAAVM